LNSVSSVASWCTASAGGAHSHVRRWILEFFVSIHRRFPGLRVCLWHLTAIAAQLCVLRPQPGSSPPFPSDPRARLEPLGVRRVAWPPGCLPALVLGWFDQCEEDRPPVSFRSRTGWRYTCSAAATNLLDFVLHFPFLVIVSPLLTSGPCNSFDYLGHFKNVDDDDDDWHIVVQSIMNTLLNV